MNCWAPRHVDGSLAPLQAVGVENWLVLSWSEYELIVPDAVSVSSAKPVTPLTLMNDPVTLDIGPPVTEKSWPSPSPTWNGIDGAFTQGTSCHSLLGYEALKHPFFGKGTCAMDFRQVVSFVASSLARCVLVPSVRCDSCPIVGEKSAHRRNSPTVRPTQKPMAPTVLAVPDLMDFSNE